MPSRNPVVSNTTPLISLVGVGLLDLLPALYQEIWIPDAVYTEYQAGRLRHPSGGRLRSMLRSIRYNERVCALR